MSHHHIMIRQCIALPILIRAFSEVVGMPQYKASPCSYNPLQLCSNLPSLTTNWYRLPAVYPDNFHFKNLYSYA
ncbi:hypothetical protein F5148DRAFT_68168 [Russula earlei]|uniref:Uncharacterized protein n=1 Tax=Russula earlei TaxID=71964 RepID=A0ACC0U853_9AGAM|nr:hypothetical protein F5148DRAFT_68168 [Russula earlei]